MAKHQQQQHGVQALVDAMVTDFQRLRGMQQFAARLPHAAGSGRPKAMFLRRAAHDGWRSIDNVTSIWLLRPTLDAVFVWDKAAGFYVLDQISLPPEHGYVHISLTQRQMYTARYSGPLPDRCPPGGGVRGAQLLCLLAMLV